MRILVLSEWFPYPPVAGAKIRTYNLIRQLAGLGEIDLISQVRTLNPSQVAIGTEHLAMYCRSVKSVPAIPYHYSVGKALQTLVDPVPPIVKYSRNRQLEQLIAQVWDKQYDLAIATISGSPSALLRSLGALGVRPLIVDSLELGGLRPKTTGKSFLQRVRNMWTWKHMRRYTRQILSSVDAITVASDIEKSLFQDLVAEPSRCIVMPNGIDLRDYDGNYGERNYNTLLYAGSFSYIANYEAMLWFTQNVFRLVFESEKLNIHVTGRTDGRDLTPLIKACPRIEFLGFVDDIRSCFARSGICIVPIRTGGSTRLKIVESMALYTPVVSTSAGAEGLDIINGENILIADTPEDFAEQINRLRNDRNLWIRLSAAGRHLVENVYSADRIGQQYVQIFDNLGI